jgi:hypothetical protein
VVKVWNVRHGKGVLVKDLIEVAAPITYGAFCPDFNKLVIGDGSGRVYLLALEDTEDEDPPVNPPGVSAGFLKVQTSGGKQHSVRRPRPFLPHDELPPPGAQAHGEQSDVREIAREYLTTAQLELHPDPTVGVIQGTYYAQTGLFRAEAHINENPAEPLRIDFTRKQMYFQKGDRVANHHRFPVLRQQQQQQQQQGKSSANANGWEQDWYTGRSNMQWPHTFDDSEEGFDQDRFDHATWLELKKERAELGDSLIDLDLDYESSIVDSDDDW